jgi:SAM-dependent MidA family methyltransferase
MKQRIVDRILADGPMTFDTYMEACLYDPAGGFFSAGPVRSGTKGDFVTSPEISWAFGYCVGEWADSTSSSDCGALVEIGAGSGSLLSEAADLWTGRGCSVYAVERSVEARARIASNVEEVNVVGSIADIKNGIDAVIVANEVLDNMPVALARRTDEDWVEIAVGVDNDELVLVDVPARDVVVDWCERVIGEVEPGMVVSAQLAVSEWVADVFDHFGKVSMCLIDYGATSEELSAREPESIVRTYRRHQAGLDWLRHPGQTDVTVDVNITGVLEAIARAGRQGRVMTQRDFVLEHGLGGIIEDARDGELLAASKGAIMHQLENRSERINMEALTDPNGLGAFQVILVE